MKAFVHLSLIPFLLSFLFVAQGFAQFTPEPYRPGSEERGKAELQVRSDEDIIWYEDFNGGLPGDWENVDASGLVSFEHTFEGPQGPYSIGMSPLNSATAYNGFMILDSDLATSLNPVGLVTDAWIQSPPIDLSDYERVQLRFQHNFRYCCSPGQVQIVAEVSTDGENWTTWDVRNGYAPNNTSPNPIHKVINISEAAAGHEQVWIRFRKTGATHYWWMIDDVMLVSYVDNDMEIQSISYNNGYIQVPAGHQQSFQFKAQVRNAGGFPQNNVVLSTSVNQLLFNGATDTLPVVDPAQQLTMVIPGEFLAPSRGVYTAEFALTQQQNDEVPQNNLATAVFHVTDTVYSRSIDVYDPEVYLATAFDEVFAAGNRFTLLSEMEATSVAFVLNENTQPGTQVQVKLFEYAEGSFTEVFSTNVPYVIGADDITPSGALTPVYVLIPFESAVVLPAGEYVAVIQSDAGNDLVLAAQNSVKQPANASFVWQEGQWTESPATPMINLHFGNHEVECDPMFDFIVGDAVCGMETGFIEVVPLTGIGPWNFVWADDPENDSPVRENLAAGEYEVTVSDGYGCVSELAVTIADVDISMEYEVIDAICATQGTITMIPLNGQEPFTYVWSHDDGFDGGTATDLAPGIYTVTVIDANGCETIETIEVGNIDEMPVGIYSHAAYCGNENGTIELTPGAGVAPFTYHWDGFDDADQAVLDNLPAGQYSFSVTDANGCFFEGNAIIEEENYELEIDYTALDASCGLNNGEISVEVINGTGPFNYEWSNSLNQPEIQNLAPGTYHLMVTDQFGCDRQESFIINSIGAMPLVNWGVTDSEDCGGSNGVIVIYSQNPEAEYLYELLNDEIGVVTENTNGNGDAPDFMVEGLPSGQYYISVISEDGCQKILTLNVSDAGAPEISATITKISCHGDNNGAIYVSVAGGTNPQYLWNDENESTTPEITNLSAGLYTLQVTDGGCFGIESFEIIEPLPLLANVSIDHIECANDQLGNIFLQTNGGTAPYTYIWSNGVSNRNLLDVPGGSYNVTITDFHNCVFQNSYTIHSADSLIVNAEIVHSDDGNANGSIIVTVTGGTGSYTYQWDDGHHTPVLTGLLPGTYTITVTDEAGCVVVKTFMVGSLDVNPHIAETRLRVYPNPVNSQIYVELSEVCMNTTLDVDILNVLGKNVKARKYDDLYGSNTLSMNVADLSPGIYIIRIKCGRQVWQSKFVKK
jgi:hypothetical protein